MGWENRPDCEECGGMWELYEITNGKRCKCDSRKNDAETSSVRSNDLLDALKRIRSMALEHPCFDSEKFEQRDWDGLTEEGGDVCDWTGIAIISDDALKTVGLGI